MLHRFQLQLKERPVEVALPDELLMGRFDPVLLEQALVNLVENALRYTPEGSPIKISAVGMSRELIIRVEDRGLGIPEEELRTIFETFQRGSGTRSDSRGAGLGLAIVRGIAYAHGGSVSARNNGEGGAVFELRLPAESMPDEIRYASIRSESVA